MIAGTGSGCGKTTVTLAVLRAMQRRKIPLAAFKCGPDYIDPMFHKAVLGIPSRNLDLFFISEREVRGQIVRSIPQNGIGVIEGVMGFYDGVSGTTDTASAAHLARETGTPAILVVRPKGQSLSLAAMLSGFRNFAENTLCGVILNGISDTMYPFYRDIVKKSGLKALGYLPSVPEAEIPDRHLGLVTADELKDLNYRLDLLADAAENRIDIEQILKISRTALQLSDDTEKISPVTKKPVRIAVARDKAFCFYYEDNFEVLRDLGAELVEFSPISDSCIPGNTVNSSAENILHRGLTIIYCLTKRNHSSDSSRSVTFQYQQAITAAVQSVDRTAGQVTASSHYYNIFQFVTGLCHLTVFPLLVSFSSITFSTAFTIFSYPVQRQRFPAICFLMASLDSFSPRSRRTVADITNPGVQNPHWIAPSSINASWILVSSPFFSRPSRVRIFFPSAQTAR